MQDYEKQASQDLRSAIASAFGSYDNFKANFSTAAAGVFGSGWAWLTYTPATRKLSITTTPNQARRALAHVQGHEPRGMRQLAGRASSWQRPARLRLSNALERLLTRRTTPSWASSPPAPSPSWAWTCGEEHAQCQTCLMHKVALHCAALPHGCPTAAEAGALGARDGRGRSARCVL